MDTKHEGSMLPIFSRQRHHSAPSLVVFSSPCPPIVASVTLSLAGCIAILGACLATREYPYGPLLLFFFLAPLYWWLLYAKFLYQWPLSDFLRALCLALVLLSVTSAGLWIGWVINGNNWDVPNKRR